MLEPMLASPTAAPLDDPHLVYEPKYDGIRAIVELADGSARLWSRLGNEKTPQFPEIVDALKRWNRGRKTPLVLDGEIVALDANGNPAGFQNLQGRIHLSSPPRPTGPTSPTSPTALLLFDILRDGRADLRDRPLTERRKALEKIVGKGTETIRISRQVRGDGRALMAEARKNGWEGLIAKHADSQYVSGKRSPDWILILCQSGLAQDQDPAGTGIRHRRLDRAAQHALLLRRAAPRRLRERHLSIRRPFTGARVLRAHGDGIQREGAGQSDAADEAARDRRPAISQQTQNERARALGAPGARRAGAVHRMDGRSKAAASRLSGAAGR